MQLMYYELFKNRGNALTQGNMLFRVLSLKVLIVQIDYGDSIYNIMLYKLINWAVQNKDQEEKN